MSSQTHTHRSSRATLARRLALDVTSQVRKRSAFAHDLIDSKVRDPTIPPLERDFAILLILGVVACSGELDNLIDRCLQSGTIQPALRDALRISVFELYFLNKDTHVAVDQGVELVRSLSPNAAGFANKILRKAAELREDFPFGDPGTDPEALGHQHAFPPWLTSRLITDLGHETAALFMKASNQQAPLFLADLQQCTTLKVSPSKLMEYLAPIQAGQMIVVDASAQEVAKLATPSTEEPFLEVGSGRGTKTILLLNNAWRTHGLRPKLYALDIHSFKQVILSRRIETCGLDSVETVVGDATDLDSIVAEGKLPHSFAGVLIDAPCSGTGTLRRHPEIRWRLTPESVTSLAAQGLAMLKAAATHVKKGGYIVYSTCSVLIEENEQVIANFLANGDGNAFALEEKPLFSNLTPGSPDAHFAAKLVKR